jgi:chemotaxis protein methyltransferase WspC
MKSHVNIDDSILAEVVERLAEAAGIAPDFLDPARIGWTIEARRRKLCLRNPAAYLDHLKASSEELEHVIDALVIHETRFFRDPAVFEQIRIWGQNVLRTGQESFRILSAPCSTGQEAYSVAAILRWVGVPLHSLTIDAFDISNAALATAQQGIYPEGALEHVSDELRALCGELRDHRWKIHDDVRRRVRFERRNLAVAGALGREPVYDLILCRNLFIYLHARARSILTDALSLTLRPGGRLIIGNGDRVSELNRRFVPLKPAAGFAFTHKQTVASNALIEMVPSPADAYGIDATDLAPRTELDRPSGSAAEYYRRAVEYTECGNLRQAERRCRQALYLDPGHVAALELLDSLWRVHPSARLRRALQARIQRLRGALPNALARGKELA